LSKEAIRKIMEAETAADKIRADAAELAKEKERVAEAEGKRLCKVAEEEALRENKAKLDLIQKKVDEKLAEQKNAADRRVRELYITAEFNMREAVKAIVGDVMDKCQ
jgi:hypothetical protein